MKEMNTWPGGEWKNVRLIGKGGYGSVYEIHREEFGKVYKAAMKVMHIPLDESEVQNLYDEGLTQEEVSQYYEKYTRRLMEELEFLSRLKGYTNIVSYEDHKLIRGEDGISWTILIRMELLTPLKQYLRKNRVGQDTVLKLARDLCCALEICHEQNIIHRDIKLDNIFVNERGDFELGDFGIARMTAENLSTMTFIGTPEFMAPEVYKKAPYGVTADIYSLGIVLYMLLNKMRRPFYPTEGALSPEDREKALKARMDGVQIQPPLYGSESVKRAVLKAVAYRAEDRFQSAAQFRLALEEEMPKSQDPREEIYQSAKAVYEAARTLEDYEKAVVALGLLKDYKDCPERVRECQVQIQRLKEEQSRRQQGSAAPANEGKEKPREVLANSASERRKPKRSPLPMIAGIAALTAAVGFGGYLFGRGGNDPKPQAITGADAEPTLVSEEKAETPTPIPTLTPTPIPTATPTPSPTPSPTPTPIPEPKGLTMARKAEVSQILTFGSYEQDGDVSNGKEEIEWIVLEKEANRVLLLSRYVLEAQPYHYNWEDVTWEESSLRRWLNETFLQVAFNEEERSLIGRYPVSDDPNPRYWKAENGDYLLQDSIFLLSDDEAEKYFAEPYDRPDDSRVCTATAYAIEQGVSMNDGQAEWWLRTPGFSGRSASLVSDKGKVYAYGYKVDLASCGVRPALWIDLNSEWM